MNDRNDIKRPKDHLPAAEEREELGIEEPHYPDTGGVEGDSLVSPDTAAEPDKAVRHGVAKFPPTGR